MNLTVWVGAGAAAGKHYCCSGQPQREQDGVRQNGGSFRTRPLPARPDEDPIYLTG